MKKLYWEETLASLLEGQGIKLTDEQIELLADGVEHSAEMEREMQSSQFSPPIHRAIVDPKLKLRYCTNCNGQSPGNNGWINVFSGNGRFFCPDCNSTTSGKNL